MCLFFFSSRRRHTRLQGDWSSDVCSSDLDDLHVPPRQLGDVPGRDRGRVRERLAEVVHELREEGRRVRPHDQLVVLGAEAGRSEERRVGKSVDLGGRRIIKKKKRKRYKEG